MKAIRDFIFIVCGLVAIAGCSTKEPKAGGKDQDDANALAKKKIVGTWVNCDSEFGETKVTARVCRTVEFKDDNKGIITHGDQTKENIAWAVSGNELRIDLTDSRIDSMFFAFTDTLYLATLSKDSTRSNLDLKAKNKNIVYHLTK